jgi:tetratricopeptide (TPR) repeat protein
LQQALALAKSSNYMLGQGIAYGQLGLTYRAIGNYPKALEVLEQQRQIALKINNWRGEATAYRHMGLVYMDMHKYTESIRAQEKYLQMTQKWGDREGEAAAYINLASVYAAINNSNKAEEYMRKAAAIKKTLLEPEPRSKQIDNSSQIDGYFMGEMGQLYLAQGKYEQAAAAFEAYLRASREQGDRRTESAALNNLAVALMGMGKFSRAAQLLYEAIEIREPLRDGLDDWNKVTLQDAQNDPYINLQLVLASLNRTEEALEIAERSRARVFAERQAESLGISLSPTASISVEQIRQVAKEQQATLVEYSIAHPEDELFIWVVQPTGEIHFRKISLKPLQKDHTSISVGFCQSKSTRNRCAR